MPQRLLRRFMPLLLWLGLSVLPLAAAAVQRALLVGVSELESQPAALWLQAPRNDVLLMRDVLQRQGFAPNDITVLADGVPGAALPQARAIREAMQQLLARSRSGDFVVLYFSGHGTRLRDPGKRYQEPDGLAENFLARDAQGAVGSGRPLSGGVRDVDMDGWIQAFLDRNVFVWSVFDTCAAASMTRGARSTGPADAAEPAGDDVRWRGVRIDQLAAGTRNADSGPSVPPAPAAAATPRARYVAFFASESHQVTPELRLPRGDRRAVPQGLLTWAVAESLQRRPATWRALFNGVLSLYPPVIDELEARYPERELPSPVAEGNLDAPLFANTTEPLTTRPQWPAQRAGDSLTVEAGQLDGLLPQQALRVLARLPDGTQRGAEVRSAQVSLAGTALALPEALRGIAGSAIWNVTPAEDPAGIVLRVRADQPLPPGLSLDYPVAVQRVGPGAPADVRWIDAGRASQRIEALAQEDGGAQGLWSAVGSTVLPDANAVRLRLQWLARMKWLARLAQLAPGRRIDGFDAAIEVWQGERLVRSDPLPLTAAWAPPSADQRLALLVRNASGHSVDLAVMSTDARSGLQAIYPERPGDANRFESGSAAAPALKRFALPVASDGRLWLVASPAAPHSAPRLFGLSDAGAWTELRVRGQAHPDRERQVFATSAFLGGAPAR